MNANNTLELIDANMMSKCSRQEAALTMFKSGNYSIGYCAEVAGMLYEDFLVLLGQNGIPMFTRTEQELLDEITNA